MILSPYVFVYPSCPSFPSQQHPRQSLSPFSLSSSESYARYSPALCVLPGAQRAKGAVIVRGSCTGKGYIRSTAAGNCRVVFSWQMLSHASTLGGSIIIVTRVSSSPNCFLYIKRNSWFQWLVTVRRKQHRQLIGVPAPNTKLVGVASSGMTTWCDASGMLYQYSFSLFPLLRSE